MHGRPNAPSDFSPAQQEGTQHLGHLWVWGLHKNNLFNYLFIEHLFLKTELSLRMAETRGCLLNSRADFAILRTIMFRVLVTTFSMLRIIPVLSSIYSVALPRTMVVQWILYCKNIIFWVEIGSWLQLITWVGVALSAHILSPCNHCLFN